MFSSYRINIVPFYFSYQKGPLFPLDQIFFGMILVSKKLEYLNSRGDTQLTGSLLTYSKSLIEKRLEQ